MALRRLWSWLDSQPKLVAAVIAVMLLAELAMLAHRAQHWRDPDASILRPPFHPAGTNTLGYWTGLVIPFADTDDNGHRASLRLYENGVRLGPANASASDIENKGQGRYRYVQANMGRILIFSTSDNSDPNTNGRTYFVDDPQAAARDTYRRR